MSRQSRSFLQFANHKEDWFCSVHVFPLCLKWDLRLDHALSAIVYWVSWDKFVRSWCWHDRASLPMIFIIVSFVQVSCLIKYFFLKQYKNVHSPFARNNFSFFLKKVSYTPLCFSLEDSRQVTDFTEDVHKVKPWDVCYSSSIRMVFKWLGATLRL